jgi:Kef-type K+ transport system membrane component KefB
MSFGTLALVSLVALLGPMLAWRASWHVPVVIGELIAGVALGPTGSSTLHSSNATFTLLADVGFALIMFTAGSHVPIRGGQLRSALGIGVLRAVLVGVVAAGLGIAVSAAFGTGHAALYAVLMASSSAALALPIIDSLKLSGPAVLQVLPQIAIADAACIIALPLVIDPTHAARAALGALAVIGCAIVLFVGLRYLETSGIRKRAHAVSEHRKFALELRVNLIVLFALAALAVQTHVSIMLAGFSFGVAVAAVGEPRRLARQLFAVSDGFFGPLFFVWLGSSLNLRELGHKPSFILLGVALGVGAALAHAVMRFTGQPALLGLTAAAQLGVPIAAATIGSQLHLFRAGEAAALLLGALIAITFATVGSSRYAARSPAPATVTPAAGNAPAGTTAATTAASPPDPPAPTAAGTGG